MAKQVRSSRKIKSPEQMGALWDEYKAKCDNYTIKRTEFSQRLGKFITEEIPKRISYTVEGFCGHIGLSRDALYTTYFSDPTYSDIATRRWGRGEYCSWSGCNEKSATDCVSFPGRIKAV